ncbi:hypothetical protein [Costertonia aggregata]|uniref:Uncharacterized protein n=1 Tax=Costertonia aggregata TaxID=343403 RepID=A0A7H9AMI5_9FLAO|nr:hypothetical protein [Costertonia aggregata]QLG44583.1 hypothetical protein HYG79_04215 [Costertonia aggregata]
MKNSSEKILSTINNHDLKEIRGMKDSLSDFFTAWVNELNEIGALTKDKHYEYTFHFTAIRDLLTDAEHFKTKNQN